MKRFLVTLSLLIVCFTAAIAQSMSDDQVIKFVVKEQKAGSTQVEIVSTLMQKGVTMEQIQRVRKKYDRVNKGTGLGTVKNDIDDEDKAIDARLRSNKGKSDMTTTEKLKDDKLKTKRKEKKDKYKKSKTYLDEDEEKAMKDELDEILPDSLDLYDRQVIRKYLREKALKEKEALKKVFGHDIFSNDELSFEPNMNIAIPADYRLGPGDEVFVDIFGASQKSNQVTVTPDGFIMIEDFGPIQVAGMTVAQANSQLRRQLGARYSNSQVLLSVGQTRSIVVNVMGEVKTPGTYTLSAFSSVFHALYMAGGPNEIGTLRNIKVYRNNQLVSTVDIYDYILNGKLSGNINLGENDVIVVEPYDCLVQIKGKVKRPMFYEMKKGESLHTLIDYAGGFTGDAYTKAVRVIRKSGTQFSVFNIGEFDMSSFKLADNDSVSVDSIIPRYSNMVELKGAVFRPGMYQLGEQINSVKSLLEFAEGVTEEAFTAHAVMHRMKPDRTLKAISVDVEGVMNGTVADIPLQNEDVLFIPTRQDAQVQRTIGIHGEVVYPGIYKYAEDETLEDFVMQAGGLKETASMHNVYVSRRVSDPYATQPDSILAQTFSFTLKEGFVIDGEPGFHLMPFDEVFVRKSPGSTTQQHVFISGEVIFAGSYAIANKNERLSDLFMKAGGATDLAYIEGARLERKVNDVERVRLLEIARMRKEEKERLMQEMAINSNRSVNDLIAAKVNDPNNLTEDKKKDEEEEFEIPETYPVGIELDKALANPGCDADIVLRDGDVIYVPAYNGTVKINGEVMYPNSVAFHDGKSANYYIKQAGGYNRYAKKNQAYVKYMNGTIAKVSDGAKIRPGCEIMVPTRALSRKMTTTELLTIGTAAASIATMIATLTNIVNK